VLQGVWSLPVALVVLALLAVGVGSWAGLGQGPDVLVATVRAAGQMALVGGVLTFVLKTPALAPVYLLVMLTAAAYTAGRRIDPDATDRGEPGGRRASARVAAIAASAIAGGAGCAGLVVIASGALPGDPRSVVPLVAQLIGGSMTATTLAGQRLVDDARLSWDQVEAWLALGATPRQAVQALARQAAARALIPALDQTRNVGLVVLPGAFVGLLLAGLGPWQAGRLQLLVLVGLLAAETVAAVTVTRLLGARLALSRPRDLRPLA
jgi:putative ABC transport system permease protein